MVTNCTLKKMFKGFPGGPVVKTVLPKQWPGFNPWSGN